MKSFWKYQVRYRAAKALMELGLLLMPDGRYKRELLQVLWQLHAKVMATTQHRSV